MVKPGRIATCTRKRKLKWYWCAISWARIAVIAKIANPSPHMAPTVSSNPGPSRSSTVRSGTSSPSTPGRLARSTTSPPSSTAAASACRRDSSSSTADTRVAGSVPGVPTSVMLAVSRFGRSAAIDDEPPRQSKGAPGPLRRPSRSRREFRRGGTPACRHRSPSRQDWLCPAIRELDLGESTTEPPRGANGGGRVRGTLGRRRGAVARRDSCLCHPRPRRTQASFDGWESPTPTELDVVLLVAEGLTNKAIAERLFVAPSTIKTHLSSIFTKLGVTTRSELTAAAIRRATNGGP